MRRGFTLVELMVVIVIIGVLSSIAVPKLSGVIAKSKASELPAAAAAYSKLQTAYAIENKKVGSWKKIGYKAPNSTNFSYSHDKLSKENSGDLGVGWRAVNEVPLEACLKGNSWTVNVIGLGFGRDNTLGLDFQSRVTSAECSVLTIGWNVVQQ